MANEALDAAFKVVVHFAAVAFIEEVEPDGLGQEGVLPQPFGLDLEVEIDAFEDLPVGPEPDSRAVTAGRRQARPRKVVQGHAAGILLAVDAAGVLLALGSRIRHHFNHHLLG